MEKYKVVFENSLDALLIVDPHKGIILEANHTVQNVLGFPHCDLVGKPFTSLYVTKKGISQEEALSKFKSYGEVLVKEFSCADGSSCLMDFTATMIPWGKSGVLLISIRDASERIKAEEERERLIGELRAAMEKIKTLRGLIPICMHCKKIRDDEGFWQRVEDYVGEHSEAQFSHGICPDCVRDLYPELKDAIENRNGSSKKK